MVPHLNACSLSDKLDIQILRGKWPQQLFSVWVSQLPLKPFLIEAPMSPMSVTSPDLWND